MDHQNNLEAGVYLTERAANHIKDILGEEPEHAGKMLRVYVEVGGCSGMQYGLVFDQIRDRDQVSEFHGVSVLVDPYSATYLKGAVIEFSAGETAGGFTISNPNARQNCICGQSFETSD